MFVQGVVMKPSVWSNTQSLYASTRIPTPRALPKRRSLRYGRRRDGEFLSTRIVPFAIESSSSTTTETATYARDLSSTPRFIQHKKEAFFFYRFLSLVYDVIVNPGHWTVDMRTDALVPAQLDDPDLKVPLNDTNRHSSTERNGQVVDVGGGTGFCTQGIVKTIQPENVTLIDQSPHQMAKAKKKDDLQGVTFMEVRRILLRRLSCRPMTCSVTGRCRGLAGRNGSI